MMYEAIKAAHDENQKQIELINRMVSEIGKPKFDYPHADFNQELFDKIVAATMDEAREAMDTDDKNIRESRWNRLIEKWHELFLADYPEMDQYLEEITLQDAEKDRQEVAAGRPPRGRPQDERDPPAERRGRRLPQSARLRPVHPRPDPGAVHPATLDTLSDNQKLDTIWEEEEKRYHAPLQHAAVLHRRSQSRPPPAAARYGHGALVEKALQCP
jgi:polyribonucleotide nucleotidyltransferase